MRYLLAFVFLFPFTFIAAQEADTEDEDSAPLADVKSYADAVELKKIDGTKITYTTDDGIKITGVFSPASEETEDPRYIILLHDLGKNKSSYANFTDKLASKGIGFLAIDMRGHGESAGQGHYSRFAKTGANNQFNKMVQDVNGAVKFLKDKRIPAKNIFVAGAGLGANVAARSIIFNEDIGGIALLTPSTNNRDVLTISGIRVSKKPVFIAAAADVKKNFFEASVIRNTAYLTEGKGKITFVTAFDKEGTTMLDSYVSPALMQWILTPELPEVKPDTADAAAVALTPSVI